MENNYKYKRVVGGYSFTDSIVRSNASSEEYLRYIITIFNSRLFMDEELMTHEMTGSNFKIIYRGIEILSENLEYIERCRAIAVSKLEEVILGKLLELGVQIDKESEFYKRVFR